MLRPQSDGTPRLARWPWRRTARLVRVDGPPAGPLHAVRAAEAAAVLVERHADARRPLSGSERRLAQARRPAAGGIPLTGPAGLLADGRIEGTQKRHQLRHRVRGDRSKGLLRALASRNWDPPLLPPLHLPAPHHTKERRTPASMQTVCSRHLRATLTPWRRGRRGRPPAGCPRGVAWACSSWPLPSLLFLVPQA